MTKTNNPQRKNGSRAMQKGDVNKLIVGPLADRIERQGARCFKQGRRIFMKLKEVDESIDIIARELARRAKGIRG